MMRNVARFQFHSKWMILMAVMGTAGLLLISLWLSILTPAGVSAASPVYVRSDGSDSQCNGTVNADASHAPDCAYSSITKGIAEVDLGGIVNVASGSYAESVALNRAITVTMSGNITVTGNLDLSAGALNAPSGILALQGNYARQSTNQFRRNNGTLKFNGSSPQSIGGDWVTGFWNLTIDNPNGVSLGFNQSIDANLTLLNGNLHLGPYSLILGPSSAVIGTFSDARMVVTDGDGSLCKGYTNAISPPIPSFLFPIGEDSGVEQYSPATVGFTAGVFGTAPKVCVRVDNSRHPDNYFPNYINRYWTLESENISSFDANLSFTYVPADLEGDETDLKAIQRTPTGWDFGEFANETAHTLTMTAVSTLTAFTGGGNESTIEVDSLAASGVTVGIRVDWDTTLENNIDGFNLYRDTGSVKPATPLNSSLIASRYSLSQPPGAYVYTDTTPAPGIYQNYWLEVVPASSAPEVFGPVSSIWYSYTIQANPQSNGILLDWSSDYQTDVAGFNLYRSLTTVRPGLPLNGITPIAAHAAPYDYEYLDTSATPGITYYYWLEMIPVAGSSLYFGPDSSAWYHTIHLPIIKNP